MRTTSDVWFAAFLMDRGIPVSGYQVTGRGRVECQFEMADEEWKKQKLEFQNSELVRYKHLIQQLKDLAF